jgi:hypothetical protein
VRVPEFLSPLTLTLSRKGRGNGMEEGSTTANSLPAMPLSLQPQKGQHIFDEPFHLTDLIA